MRELINKWKRLKNKQKRVNKLVNQKIIIIYPRKLQAKKSIPS